MTHDPTDPREYDTIAARYTTYSMFVGSVEGILAAHRAGTIDAATAVDKIAARLAELPANTTLAAADTDPADRLAPRCGCGAAGPHSCPISAEVDRLTGDQAWTNLAGGE